MINKIETKIKNSLDIHYIEIIDNSNAHKHHNKESKGGHYTAIIISDSFIDKSLVERHQMVYTALGDMLQNEIHAFSMKTLTKIEFKNQ